MLILDLEQHMYPVRESMLIILQSLKSSSLSWIPNVRHTSSMTSSILTLNTQTMKFSAPLPFGGLPSFLTLPKKLWFHSPHASSPPFSPASPTMSNPYEMLPFELISFCSTPSRTSHPHQKFRLQHPFLHPTCPHREQDRPLQHLHSLLRNLRPVHQREIESLAAMDMQNHHQRLFLFLRRNCQLPAPFQFVIVRQLFPTCTTQQGFQSRAPPS